MTPGSRRLRALQSPKPAPSRTEDYQPALAAGAGAARGCTCMKDLTADSQPGPHLCSDAPSRLTRCMALPQWTTDAAIQAQHCSKACDSGRPAPISIMHLNACSLLSSTTTHRLMPLTARRWGGGSEVHAVTNLQALPSWHAYALHIAWHTDACCPAIRLAIMSSCSCAHSR